MKPLYYACTLLCTLLFSSVCTAQKAEYLTTAEFHALAFPETPMHWQTLWIGKTQRAEIEKILGRKNPALRIRYWGEGDKTAWIFEEVGKELPITVGVVVAAGAIQQVHIMNYRESRGGEVRHAFFTSQFTGATLLDADNNWQLDQKIDGITGATLSVRALKKIATLALYCHTQTPFAK